MAKTFYSKSSTMRVWQYTSTKGGIENNLKLNEAALMPKPKPDEHLVQILAMSLNPVDYKPSENLDFPLIGSLILPKPATPGIDFAGCIVKPASNSSLKIGDLVFGGAGSTPLAGGALAEFALVKADALIPIPEGVKILDAPTLVVAALTAYQSVYLRVKSGDKIFINGGSGGTGTFAIQFAKLAGCHVTTSCSTVNVELCKSLGADVILDYKKENILESLIASEIKFDHVVDNVGYDRKLIWSNHMYMKPEAVFICVGGEPSLENVLFAIQRKLWPRFAGGLKRAFEGFWPAPEGKDLQKIAEWVSEGKVRVIVDTVFPFEEAVAALRKLKTGRAKGKIVVDIASNTYTTSWSD